MARSFDAALVSLLVSFEAMAILLAVDVLEVLIACRAAMTARIRRRRRDGDGDDRDDISSPLLAYSDPLVPLVANNFSCCWLLPLLLDLGSPRFVAPPTLDLVGDSEPKVVLELLNRA